ncbi:MAG: hypothetical protein IJX17_06410 [Clostridia bacterium]|nr:hypothetical protein [Clostridia bacterium]
MQSKRLRLWIIIGSVILAIIGLFLFLILGFRLKTVDVEFQSRLTQSETKLEQGIQENVKKHFKYKDNIILMRFDDTIAEIEKENPFIKVNQVIKYFPKTVRVYVSERVPKYRVKDNQNLGEWLILDGDFKILDKVTDENLKNETLYRNSSYFKKTVEILSENLSITGNVGEFISKDDIMFTVNEIMSGVYGRTEDYLSVNSISITDVDGKKNYNIIMRNVAIDDGNGCKILVEGSDNLLTKVFVGISTFQSEIQKDSTINTPKTTIRIYYSNGEYKGIKIVE